MCRVIKTSDSRPQLINRNMWYNNSERAGYATLRGQVVIDKGYMTKIQVNVRGLKENCYGYAYCLSFR